MADETDIEGNSLDALIAGEIRQALNFNNSDIVSKRSLALAYMRGEMPDLPARPNGSTQTSRDVADTISKALPGVVRVFTAAAQMVTYEQTEEGDEEWASEASEYMNYSFFSENDGYHILLNATNDSLLMGNGLVCSYWEEPQTKTETFRDMSPLEAQAKLDEGWQPIPESLKEGKPERVEQQDPMTGEMVALDMPTITLKMTRTTKPGRICDISCIPENLVLSADATSIDDARMVGYLMDTTTRSDLLEMADEYGWSDEAVQAIKDAPAYNRGITNATNVTRPVNAFTDDSPVRSGDLMELYEVYARYDVDGDGIAEQIRAWYLGNGSSGDVLGWDEWEDDIPYTDIPCYPVPHQFEAESLFDRTADIQRVKTTLLRQALDNTYASNMPMREAEVGSVLNPDILVTPKFGGIIWKKAGSNPIVPHVIPFTADKSWAAMEYMDKVRVERTGISTATAALDPEALTNQTATASQLSHDVNYSQIEFIARNQAELGWKKHFRKRLKLAIKHEQVKAIPSDKGDEVMGEDGQPKPGNFRTVTPEKWSPDMRVSINVGLGTGSRDRDMQMLTGIMIGQREMAAQLDAAGFKAKALEFIPKIRMAAVKAAEATGLKNADDYYPEITEEEVKQMQEMASQPQPDPAAEAEKAKAESAMQLEQVKAQSAQQLKQVDAQVSVHQAQLQAEGEVVKNRAELEADLATKDADRKNALMLEQQRQQFEWNKFQAEMAFRERESQQKMDIEMLKISAQAHAASASAAAKGEGKSGSAPQDMSELFSALHAPKRIVRDANGRATGIETITQGAGNA